MDFDSSSKFISSLAKFLQSLCNGYVEFDNGVEVIGHIYINVDTGKKIDYVLNEKVCKTDENSVTFISNSFHAQPAEKPKPTDKISASQSNDNESAVGSHEDEIIIMDEPESSNIGTLPLHQQQQKRPSKRSHQEKFSSSHRQQSKYSRTNQSVGQTNGSQSQNSDSLHSENSSKELAGHFPGNSIVTAATESDMSHLSSVFPQSFNDPPSSQLTDDKDIKPQLDADLNVVNVKQEYDPSQEGVEEDQEGYNDSQGPVGDYSAMQYDDYYGDISQRGQGADYGQMGGSNQIDYYQGGAGVTGDGSAGDSSDYGKVEHKNAVLWVPGGGCPVPGCGAKKMGHVQRLRQHWSEKHERLVSKLHCSVCFICFKRRSDLRKHFKLKHPSENSDYCVGKIDFQPNQEYLDPGNLCLEDLLKIQASSSYYHQ